MGTSVNDLSISLEHDIDEQYQYQPGEIVRGQVTMVIIKPTILRTISIGVYGQGAVAWEDPEYGSFQANEEYINASQVIKQHSEYDPLSPGKGRHKFPFEYHLPDSLPSSFIGKYGSVTYVLKAVVHGEKPGETSITSEPFLILRNVPLPEMSRKGATSFAHKRFWAMCSTGKIKVNIKINKVGAVPGEDIFVDAEVANRSPVRVTAVQACIIMNSLYHARQRAIPFRQIVNKRRDEYELMKGDGRRWQNVRLTIPPYIPETGLEFCDIIEISYTFQFRVETSGGKEIMLTLPILIGSHPAGLELPANGTKGNMNKKWNTTIKDFPTTEPTDNKYNEQQNELWHDGIIPELRSPESTMINPIFEKAQTNVEHRHFEQRKFSEEELPEIIENTKL